MDDKSIPVGTPGYLSLPDTLSTNGILKLDHNIETLFSDHLLDCESDDESDDMHDGSQIPHSWNSRTKVLNKRAGGNSYILSLLKNSGLHISFAKYQTDMKAWYVCPT